MVSGPTAISGSPMVHFRPDPGEPAVRLAAPPQQTALLVASQEQRNETRLRSRSIAQGEDVLYSNRTFTLGLGSGSPVYNGGLTTVVTRPDNNGFLPDQTLRPVAEEESAAEETQSDEEDESSLAAQSLTEETNEKSEEEIEQEEQELENEDSRLNQNLTRAFMEQNRAIENGDIVQFEEARREQLQLTRELEENEKEQRELELEKLEAKMEEFQQITGEALEDNASSAMGILDVMFGFAPDQTTTPRTPSFSFAS